MARYKANHAEIARWLRSQDIRKVVEHEANRIAEHLRVTAPRDNRDKDADHYADHFSVEVGYDVLKHSRRAAFVVNDSPYASVLELGSAHVKDPPQPITKLIESTKD